MREPRAGRSASAKKAVAYRGLHVGPFKCRLEAQAQDLAYLQRCVERFQRVLSSGDRKLFVILNLNRLALCVLLLAFQL